MGLYTKMIDMQKLNKAWERIRKSKPACGVDQMTWEEFDENKREELKQLYLELSEGRYQPQPVKLIQIFRDNKSREVSLYTMRDKVVQNSVTEELCKIYFPLFPDCSYAYRPRTSALQAVAAIEAQLKKGIYSGYFRGDIKQFFDHIQLDILRNMLKKRFMRSGCFSRLP